MKKRILVLLIVVALIAIFVAIAGLRSTLKISYKLQGRDPQAVTDSLRTDSTFRSEIAILEKSIDSLLPYDERRQFIDSLYRIYRENVALKVEDRKSEAILESDINTAYGERLAKSIELSVKYELEENNQGRQHIEMQYNEWSQIHSKDPIMQEHLEDKLSDLRFEYLYF